MAASFSGRCVLLQPLWRGSRIDSKKAGRHGSARLTYERRPATSSSENCVEANFAEIVEGEFRRASRCSASSPRAIASSSSGWAAPTSNTWPPSRGTIPYPAESGGVGRDAHRDEGRLDRTGLIRPAAARTLSPVGHQRTAWDLLLSVEGSWSWLETIRPERRPTATNPSQGRVPRTNQLVERLPWLRFSPQMGHQIARIGTFPSAICGRYQLNADFLNRLDASTHWGE